MLSFVHKISSDLFKKKQSNHLHQSIRKDKEPINQTQPTTHATYSREASWDANANGMNEGGFCTPHRVKSEIRDAIPNATISRIIVKHLH